MTRTYLIASMILGIAVMMTLSALPADAFTLTGEEGVADIDADKKKKKVRKKVGAWKPCELDRKTELCETGKPTDCLTKKGDGKMWYFDANNNNIQDKGEPVTCSDKNPNASKEVKLPPKR